jgi:hypothetical protein
METERLSGMLGITDARESRQKLSESDAGKAVGVAS